MTGFFCLYSCSQRATCAGSAPTLTNLKFSPSALISVASFCWYDGSPPRNMPCEPDSGDLNRVSLPFRPFQVLNSGCCFIRYVGMYQPMTPLTPFGPARTTVFCFVTYWSHCGTWPQSSRIASVLPSAIAWYTGTSATFVTLTLHP